MSDQTCRALFAPCHDQSRPLGSAARALRHTASLTLGWLLEEMMKADLVGASLVKQLVQPPPRKDGGTQHPLVVAAAQEWPDPRNPGRKLSIEVLHALARASRAYSLRPHRPAQARCRRH